VTGTTDGEQRVLLPPSGKLKTYDKQLLLHFIYKLHAKQLWQQSADAGCCPQQYDTARATAAYTAQQQPW